MIVAGIKDFPQMMIECRAELFDRRQVWKLFFQIRVRRHDTLFAQRWPVDVFVFNQGTAKIEKYCFEFHSISIRS